MVESLKIVVDKLKTPSYTVIKMLSLNLLPGTDDFNFIDAGHFLRWARGNAKTLAELGRTSLTAQKDGKAHVTIELCGKRWIIGRFF